MCKFWLNIGEADFLMQQINKQTKNERERKNTQPQETGCFCLKRFPFLISAS